MVLEIDSLQPGLDYFSTWHYRVKERQAPYLSGVNESFSINISPLILPANSYTSFSSVTTGSSGYSPGPADSDDGLVPITNYHCAPCEGPRPAASEIEGEMSIAAGKRTLLEDITLRQTGPSSLAHGLVLSRKRRRPIHDVDGVGTADLPSKKRRIRHQLITSRLSKPYSLPATHILNRESNEDIPVISRFVKGAALAAKKAGHQTGLVRKAAILNRVRLNVRQSVMSRPFGRMWRLTEMDAMGHGFQLVTDSTGAMFPGRSGEQVPGPIVPRAWRAHTTTLTTSVPTTSPPSRQSVANLSQSGATTLMNPIFEPGLYPSKAEASPRPTAIMTPLAGADEDEASFPDADFDFRYSALDEENEDDIDGVYADFGVLFGGGARSPEGPEEPEHFYEEYLDEVDGIVWAS